MPKEKRYFVYLLTNWNNEVMYVGVTNDLDRRVYEHKNKFVKGFTEKYNVNKLVYFEETGDVTVALAREKEIKKWRREKKNGLVLSINPDWKDLSERAKDFSHSFEMTACWPIKFIGPIFVFPAAVEANSCLFRSASPKSFLPRAARSGRSSLLKLLAHISCMALRAGLARERPFLAHVHRHR